MGLARQTAWAVCSALSAMCLQKEAIHGVTDMMRAELLEEAK